jgi:hypothetical protein
MALTNFKDIISNIGYFVNSKDRNIFQKELIKSYFGQGYSDVIEFVMYDLSGNILPQASVDGAFVRYLNLDLEDVSKISKYFIIADPQPNIDIPEYVIDLELLISEAGYSSGVFKTQVTLLNRRIGVENSSNDRLWIEEISPSRTEIRVLPVRNPDEIEDLEKRYSIFVNDGNFRDDTVYYIQYLFDKLDLQKVKNRVKMEAGDEDDGDKFLQLLQTEFKIDGDFEVFLKKIEEDVIEALNYFYRGKVYLRSDINYGNTPTNGTYPELFDKIELSISDIKKVIERIILDVIDNILLKREVDKYNTEVRTDLTTIDTLNDIIKTTANAFNSYTATVVGCRDPKASNYNPEAVEDDGSCDYTVTEIRGCTNKGAINYNKYANVDDGSCKFVAGDTGIFYIWSHTATIRYKNPQGIIKTIVGKEFERYTINYIGDVQFTGDVRRVPKPTDQGKVSKKYRISFSPKQVNAQVPNSAYFTYRDIAGNTINKKLNLNESIVICAEQDSLVLPKYFQLVELGNC